MGDLTAHFSAKEFRDQRANVTNDPPCRLLAVLENLRGQVGRPLTIVSGFRTPSTNAAVGGAKLSRHLWADAVDIPSGYATTGQAVAAGAVGIGSRGIWAVHIDVRPGGPARWSYDVATMLDGTLALDVDDLEDV